MKKKAENKKAKAVNKSASKAVVKKASVDRDTYGFTKGSKSSQAVLQLASKALLKDVRKKFSTLSFNRLFVDLKSRGFKVENKDGLCFITK